MMSEVRTLATLILGGPFDETELSDNDVQINAKAADALQLERVTGQDDVHIDLVDRAEFDRVIAERDALQQRLNAADQRIDDFAGGDCEWSRDDDSGIWNSACGSSWSFHDDGPAENGMNFCHCCGKNLVVEAAETEQDDDWHMNPCKQGHLDVGAAGGVAACNQCDEKIEAATTQEAFDRWNATHPQQ